VAACVVRDDAVIGEKLRYRRKDVRMQSGRMCEHDKRTGVTVVCVGREVWIGRTTVDRYAMRHPRHHIVTLGDRAVNYSCIAIDDEIAASDGDNYGGAYGTQHTTDEESTEEESTEEECAEEEVTAEEDAAAGD
jgi:hypothetical protein